MSSECDGRPKRLVSALPRIRLTSGLFCGARRPSALCTLLVTSALDGQWTRLAAEFIDDIRRDGEQPNRSSAEPAHIQHPDGHLVNGVMTEARMPDPREIRPFVFQ